MRRVAVFGLGVAGAACARAMASRGLDVRLADDQVRPEHRRLADELDAPIRQGLATGDVEGFLADADTLVPAPGVSPGHAIIRAALERGIDVRSEIDIAYEWENARPGGARPILAVTGTDGKTTVTSLVARICAAAGHVAAEVGNTDLPFVSAVDGDAGVFVVECSSFRLHFTRMFRADAATWLNLAPDHLDWHGTLDEYAGAKARLWRHATADDVAVVPVEDPVVMASVAGHPGRVVEFGLAAGRYRCEEGVLVGPGGAIAEVGSMSRALPHDLTNALAAAALCLETGLATPGDVAGALARFEVPPHRIELVGTFDGVEWYDDSKATSPHAASAAIGAFRDIVLIAGGRNKDLDLSPMAAHPDRIKAVVAIGADADAIAGAFESAVPVVRADSMRAAVDAAGDLARPGDTVLLSPGCTSLDWYGGYAERGRDFAQLARARAARTASTAGSVDASEEGVVR